MGAFAMGVEIQGADNILAHWDKAPDVMREEMTRATWEAELLLEREVKDGTPVGVGGAGGLRGSIAAGQPQVLANRVLGAVGTSIGHALPVEIGTKPHFPPIAPLRDWVEHKLDVPEADSYGVALKIARKIAARGTLAVGMFHRAFASTRGQVNAMYTNARHRIYQQLGGK